MRIENLGRQLSRLALAGCLLAVGGCGGFGGDTAQEHLERAAALLAKGDARGSQIEIKNALQKEPENAACPAQIGESYAQAGNFQGAQKELNHALNSGRTAAVLPLARSYAITQSWEPLSDLPLAADLPAPVRAEVLALKARAALAGGDRDGAEKLLSESEAAQSGTSPAAYGRAILAFNDKQQEAGDDWLKKALAADPDNADALTLSADIAAGQGRMADAEAQYSRAIDLRPVASGSELLKRGMVRLSLKKFDDARKDADALKKMAPEHPGVAYLDGLLKLSAGDYSAAQTAFEISLSKAPDYQPVIFYLGAVHALQDHQEQADHYLGTYLRSAPGSAAAARLAAGVKVRANDIEGATQILERAAAANPKDAAIHDLLGRMYAAQGDPKGIEMLKQAVALQPDSAALRERLGIAMLLGGQQDQGRGGNRSGQPVWTLTRGRASTCWLSVPCGHGFQTRACRGRKAARCLPRRRHGVQFARGCPSGAERYRQGRTGVSGSPAPEARLGGGHQQPGSDKDRRKGMWTVRCWSTAKDLNSLRATPRSARVWRVCSGAEQAGRRGPGAAYAVKKNPTAPSLRILLARIQSRAWAAGRCVANPATRPVKLAARAPTCRLAAGDMALAKKDFAPPVRISRPRPSSTTRSAAAVVPARAG